MTTIGTIELIATIDTSKYKKGAAEIKSTNSSVAQSTNDVEKDGSKAWEKYGNAAKSAAKVVAGASVAIAGAASALVVASVKSTADLEQSWGGSEVVFGKYSKEIQKLAQQSAKVMGTSTNEYLETANKMGSLFQGAGFSVKDSMTMSADAMQRATDVATAMGISTDMALESIAGAAKGNFTMMDNLGVAMNETTLEAYRLEKGMDKAVTKMTSSEKVGLAMQLFMERTAKYAGNYAKENETLAGSFQTLKGAWGNFMSGVEGSDKQLSDAMMNMSKVLGKQLPVIIKTLGQNFVNLWSNLKDGSPEFRRFADGVENGIKVVTTVVGVIRQWLPLIVGVTAAYVGYRAAIIASNAVMAIHSALIYAMGTRYVVMNGSIIAVRGAVTAATVAQAAWNAVMSLNPIGLVIGAVAGLTAGIALLSMGTNKMTSEERYLNDTKQKSIEISNALLQAEKNLKDGRRDAEASTLAVERAQRTYNETVDRYGRESLEAREAALNLKDAQDRLNEANSKVKASTQEVNTQLDSQRQLVQGVINKLDSLNGKTVYFTMEGQQAGAWKQNGKNFIGGTFATGGYTGRGGTYEPAGIVHKGEYVIPKKFVNQSTGLPDLDNLIGSHSGGGDTFNITVNASANMIRNENDKRDFANMIMDSVNQQRRAKGMATI